MPYAAIAAKAIELLIDAIAATGFLGTAKALMGRLGVPVGPARLPAADVKRIHAAFAAAMAMPEVQEAMAKQGNVINPSTPEAAGAFFRSEQDRYAKLVQKAGVKLD